jgi:hypothetical protein
VQDNFNAAHLFVAEDTVVCVVEKENAETLSLEVVLIVQPEVGGTQRKNAEEQDGDGGKRWRQSRGDVAEERKRPVLLLSHWAEPPRLVVITKSHET